MQKKILYNLLAVSLCGIILSTALLFTVQTAMSQKSANEMSVSRLNYVEERISSNNKQLAEMTEMVRKTNLSHARALAMLIEMNPGIINDADKLKEAAAMLDVDEIHIIDENGILRWGTQPFKYGMNFAGNAQTRPFLAILDDPSVEISQVPMPNASLGVLRQYAGVSLRHTKGIAEVGVSPALFEKASENNRIEKVIRGITVGNRGYMFLTDASGLIHTHPNPKLVATPLPKPLQDSGLLNIDGQTVLYHTRNIQNQLVVAAFPITEMYEARTFSTSFFLVFIMFLFSSFCTVVNFYIKKDVITGIHGIAAALGEITAGQLQKNVNIRSCAEFSDLSDGINHMLASINTKIAEVEKLADDKERLAAIVSITDAGIIVKDKDGVVLEWNSGAENIFGYHSREMIGFTTHYYAPESSHDGIDQLETSLRAGESIVRADVVRKHKNGRLVDCSASYTPIFDENKNFIGSVAVFHDISDKKQMEVALQEAVLAAESKHQTIMSSISYASKIQKNLLPPEYIFKKAFSDYSIIWKPKDIVGGDIYWIKNFDEGTVLCVCDCTGHGTPGALLTMLVVSVFEAAVNENNYQDTAGIIWNLERRLVSALNVNTPEQACVRKKSDINDGCDLAVLYIAKDGSAAVSAGNMPVFICDGKEVTQIKGQRIFIGEGTLKSKEDVRVVKIPANPDNKFYIASDGLYDQVGGECARPFGYKLFKQIILENHNEKQAVISEKIYEAFENYRGGQARRDDLELITFKP